MTSVVTQKPVISTRTQNPITVIDRDGGPLIIDNFTSITYDDGIAPAMDGIMEINPKTGQEEFRKLSSKKGAEYDPDYSPYAIHQMAQNLGWEVKDLRVAERYASTDILYSPTERVVLPQSFEWDSEYWNKMRANSTNGEVELVARLHIPLSPLKKIVLEEAAYRQVCRNGLMGYEVFHRETLYGKDITPFSLQESLEKFTTYAFRGDERLEQFSRNLRGEEIGWLTDGKRDQIMNLFHDIAEWHDNDDSIPMDAFPYAMRKLLKSWDNKNGLGAPWFLKQLNRQMNILPELLAIGDLKNAATNAANSARELGLSTDKLPIDVVVESIPQLMAYQWN